MKDETANKGKELARRIRGATGDLIRDAAERRAPVVPSRRSRREQDRRARKHRGRELER